VDDLKVVVEINGIQYDTDQVKSFLTFFENGVLRVSLTINDSTPSKEEIVDVKAPDVDLTNPYISEGVEYSINDEMYENLKQLSNLRGHTKKKGIKETKEIQSETYDVREVTSFNDAVKDIINQENELFDQNYKFYAEVAKPTAIFESPQSGIFKLVEKIVVIKVKEKKDN